jgi:hypothetical protein
MARPIDQQIAETEARLARLKSKNRSLETGQKIVLGGLLLNGARTHDIIRKWVITQIESSVTRPADKIRLAPLLEELKKLDPQPPSKPTSSKPSGSTRNIPDKNDLI